MCIVQSIISLNIVQLAVEGGSVGRIKQINWVTKSAGGLVRIMMHYGG